MKLYIPLTRTPITDPDVLASFVQTLQQLPSAVVDVIDCGASFADRSLARYAAIKATAADVTHIYMPDLIDVINMDLLQAEIADFADSEYAMLHLVGVKQTPRGPRQGLFCKAIIERQPCIDAAHETLGLGLQGHAHIDALASAVATKQTAGPVYSWRVPRQIIRHLKD